ncbi:MAG: hypothetical protein ACD_23C00450G0001 [uncultured bacterium]|nr:MAG: hypothetical protein ACD_23C00450G0001 [uncultured bacterium]
MNALLTAAVKALGCKGGAAARQLKEPGCGHAKTAMVCHPGIQGFKCTAVWRVIAAGELDQPGLRADNRAGLCAHLRGVGVEIDHCFWSRSAGRATRARQLGQHFMAIVHQHGLHLLCQVQQSQVPVVKHIGQGRGIGERPHGVCPQIGQPVEGRHLVWVNTPCFHAAVHQPIAPAIRQGVIN